MKQLCIEPGCQFPRVPKRKGRCQGHADAHKLELTKERMRRYRERLAKKSKRKAKS